MNPRLQTELDQKRAAMDAALAELSANQEAIQKARDEFDMLRPKARAESAGLFGKPSKAMQRLEELDAEISRLSRKGFDLQKQYSQAAQAWSDVRTANMLNNRLGRRLA